MAGLRRRDFGRVAGGGLAAAVVGVAAPAVLRAQTQGRLIVIGGGPGGATVAKYVAKDSQGAVAVTLVEPSRRYTTCFYSNLYLAGWRSLESITHVYDKLGAYGVRLVHDRAVAVDPTAKTVRLANGETLAYDKLVVAPGIDLVYGSIEGYSEDAAQRMPHSWKAGEQTKLLRAQLEAMPDGGTFILAAPPNPFRCPPGPYERVSCVAAYFKQAKPRAKILVLDAKDSFSKQALFQEAWKTHYDGMVEWVPAEFGGKVVRVDPASLTVVTADGEQHRADVANIVPAQKAGAIAREAGLADDAGWCPIDPASMASKKARDVWVLGDACIAGDMPKSAFSANSQAKVAAMVVRGELTGSRVFPARYRNTCWSSLAPDDAVKIGANYEPTPEKIKSVDPFISQTGESREVRAQTRAEADSWYAGITADIFG